MRRSEVKPVQLSFRRVMAQLQRVDSHRVVQPEGTGNQMATVAGQALRPGHPPSLIRAIRKRSNQIKYS